MRILSAKIENYCGVKLFDATFNSNQNVIEITGKNGQGKTGTLDGIWAALAGKGVVAENPIREGEDAATLRLDLGHMIVTRKFKRKEDREFTTMLTVSTPEGARFPSPQDRLSALFNTIALDPIQFMREDQKRQTQIFRSLIDDFDFEANDQSIKDLSAKRTDANREVSQLQARVDGVTLPAKLPAEKIDEDALIEQLTNAQQHNQQAQNEHSRREACKSEAASLRDRANHQATESSQSVSQAIEEGQRLIEEATAKAAELKKQAEQNALDLRQASEKTHEEAASIESELESLDPIPERINPLELQEQLSDAKASNALYEKKVQYDKLLEELRLKKLDAKELDDRINSLRKTAEHAVKNADLPVSGLGFDENGLVYQGLPLSQASKAEQIRVCCGIVAALNPALRICRISDGSLLDNDSFQLLESFAEKYDMQVFIETVESGREGAIVIKAGEIADQE